jgi:predicted Rossmann fold nucleotide-binding protein DprA/Smf involved in DNA uptake
MKKVAIVGSRNFTNRNVIIEFMRIMHDVEIVSGGAKGVDAIAEEIAKEMGLPVKIFKPDFSKGYHVSAYHERNKQIVDYADEVHIFWHQPTRGSMSTLRYAKSSGKPYYVHEVK